MDKYAWILFIVAGVALATAFVWFLVTLFSEKKKVKDAPIILNFLAPLGRGFFLGSQIEDVYGNRGRHVIKYEPKDIDMLTDDVNKIEEQMKPETTIVDKNKLFVMPKGSISQERNILFALPKSASDFPEALKDSLIGKGLMWAVEAQNAINAEIKSLNAGHDRKDKILEDMGNGEASREFLQWQRELFQDTLKDVVSTKNRDNRSIFNPNLNTNRDNPTQ